MSATDRRLGVSGSAAFKTPCAAATTANLPDLEGLLTIDGVTLVTGDRVLVKDQTSGVFNGIYVADTSSWLRAVDFNGPRDIVKGTLVLVVGGSVNGNIIFEQTAASPTIGTTSLVFVPTTTDSLSGASAYIQTLLPALTALEARTILGAVGLTGDETVAGIKTFTGDNVHSGANTFSGSLTMSAQAIKEAVRVDVASATTCDIGAALSNYVRITGTTTITGLGSIASGARRHVVFAGILTLTHNATSLILPNAGSNITTAAGDGALFESDGAGNWKCLHYQKANGTALRSTGQLVSTQSGAVATGTTLMPWDNSIPQITEGDEYMTRTITPQSATSTLRIDVVFNFSNSVADVVTAALFQDATANALRGASSNALDQNQISFSWVMTSGTTSLTTFRVRAGPNSSGTLTFNGNAGARKLGGVMASGIYITETLP